MVIISKSIINDFGSKHSIAAEPLNRWYFQTKLAEWKNLADIKADFPSVDYVGNDRYVFNIKGNDYRLVAMIFSMSEPFIYALLEPMPSITERT